MPVCVQIMLGGLRTTAPSSVEFVIVSNSVQIMLVGLKTNVPSSVDFVTVSIRCQCVEMLLLVGLKVIVLVTRSLYKCLAKLP